MDGDESPRLSGIGAPGKAAEGALRIGLDLSCELSGAAQQHTKGEKQASCHSKAPQPGAGQQNREREWTAQFLAARENYVTPEHFLLAGLAI